MARQVLDVFAAPELQPLSNFASGYGFWLRKQGGLPWEREWWPSAEHYFQAGKFSDPDLKERIRCANGAEEAKGLGRQLSPLRPDWDAVKRARIHRAMLEKLWEHEGPRRLLASTGTAKLVNGNPVDGYFGTGRDGQGHNVIGEELEALRSFFGSYPRRRTCALKVGTVGEPFEPFRVTVDLTGLAPAEVPEAVAEVLQVPVGELEAIELVTEDGFEKTSLASFEGREALEAFLSGSADDCVVEANLAEPVVVTLWDASNDCFLAYADVRVLCPDPASLRRRLALLLPALDCPAFGGSVECSVNGEDAFAVDAASFARLSAAASAGDDVLIRGHYAAPTEAQPSLRKAPQDLGPCRAICGDHTALDEGQLADRVRGVIWGAALGDAVGLATEFMKKEEAAKAYPDVASLGPAVRCQDRHRSRWSPGDWTDDTDQMVLLLDALVAGKGVLDQKSFAKSLRKWKEQGFPELGDTAGLGIGQTVHSVLEHPGYEAAPDVVATIVWRQGGETMAANGAVMRCAAAGIPYFWEEAAVDHNAAASAALTHADPRCAASCVAVCALISRVLLGGDLSDIERRREEVLTASWRAAAYLAGGSADELAQYMDVPADGLEGLRLGQGGIGYTFKPLGAACWAFLHATDFRRAIQQITMEAGDADSNAVVAGALLGARLGYTALPQDWIEAVPSRQRLWMEEKVAKILELLGLRAVS